MKKNNIITDFLDFIVNTKKGFPKSNCFNLTISKYSELF